jgi:hypothetical protein
MTKSAVSRNRCLYGCSIRCVPIREFHEHTHTHTHTHTYACTLKHTYKTSHMFLHTQNTYTHPCAQTHTHICMYTQTHIQKLTHVLTHTKHIFTHMRTKAEHQPHQGLLWHWPRSSAHPPTGPQHCADCNYAVDERGHWQNGCGFHRRCIDCTCALAQLAQPRCVSECPSL